MKLSGVKVGQKQNDGSYRSRVRKRFQQEIIDISTKYSLAQLVMVLDQKSAFLLSNILTMSQLVAMKVVYVQRLEVKRKKLDKHAVYFVNPTKDNINLIINDFPLGNGENHEVPQYKKIHILFTTFIDKSILKLLAVHKGVLKRIAKNSIKQFYFSSRILAENLIDINACYLKYGFSKQCEQQINQREVICQKIIQFIANYSSINTIRIFYKKSPNKICQNISLNLQKTIKNYLGILLTNRSPNLSQNADDLTILMMDRSVDTVTPFVHYLTYQSLLFDFFKINMVTKNALQDKSAYSYQQIQNQIYQQFRYKHISQALGKLPQLLQDQKGKLQQIKSLQTTDPIAIQQVTQRIGDIKQNIQKLTSIWKQFKQQKIQQISQLQQSLATGITANGQNTSSVKLINQICQIVKNGNGNKLDKIRLAILGLSCVKLAKGDYENLINMFEKQDQKILKNLVALGVSYDSSTVKSTKTVTKDQQKIASKRMQKTSMNLNRYTSIIQLVVPLFCKLLQTPSIKQIDKDVFGQLKCEVFSKKQDQKIKFNKNKFAVCMIGGMSWAEVSAIRSLDDMGNVVLMADAVMTVGQFLDEIGKINIIS